MESGQQHQQGKAGKLEYIGCGSGSCSVRAGGGANDDGGPYVFMCVEVEFYW